VSYRNPWELILLKAWAKKLQGYHRIKESRPFEFIESFSNPTWKYFNLTKSPDLFLKRYSNFIRTKSAKIVLKSKDDGNVSGHGFLPNSAAFEIVKGSTEAKNGQQEYHLAVRSTSKSSWAGSLGYHDKDSIQSFKQITPSISLERGFLISGTDLLNNFSAAYITSTREKHYFTGYRIL
jgi:hypothetical protein